jgi:hypothetical protein
MSFTRAAYDLIVLASPAAKRKDLEKRAVYKELSPQEIHDLFHSSTNRLRAIALQLSLQHQKYK